MKTEKTAFIWDLDGTLLESYEVIVSSLYRALQAHGIFISEEQIRKEVITGSVKGFISLISERTEVPFDQINSLYSRLADEGKYDITANKDAGEILRFIKGQGMLNYVFTHRGPNALIILQNIGLLDWFDEVITRQDGFARKPDPAAVNYLVEKHELDRERTFYVGDRTIDIDCAVNAGIASILYLPEGSVTKPTGRETYTVSNLLEIRDIIRKL